MYYKSWDAVVVQWVNCLEISNPIENIENCKDGEFFDGLLHALNKSWKISNASVNLLETVRNLLKPVYKNIEFDTRRSRITDLSEDEIIELSLLLMHYACVIERNHLLINPLCQKLPHKTQLCLEKFFERMTVKVDNSSLQEIALESINTTNSMLSRGTSIEDSPLKATSPLRDYYTRTPSNGKKKSLERVMEMERLMEELDAERFERTALERDVEESRRKIRKLEGKVRESGAAICELQTQLCEREGREERLVVERVETERCLKEELEKVERYSERAEAERVKLQEQNDKLANKLKICNEELNNLVNRNSNLEAEHWEMSEKHRQQAEELENLRAAHSELALYLEEQRSSSSEMNSSACNSMNSTKRRSLNYSMLETVASSVIELQLDECRTENTELKESLLEFKEKTEQLNKDLDAVRTRYLDANRRCLEIESENGKLMSKIQEITESHENMKKLMEESQQEINKLSVSLSDNDSVVSILQQSVSQASDLNSKLQIENQELKCLLAKIEQELQSKCVVLKEKDLVCESLKTEAKNLQEKYDKAVLKFTNSSTNFNNLQKRYNDAMEKFSKSLEKLLLLNIEQRDEIMEDKFEMLDKLSERIKEEKLKDKSTIERLTVSLSAAEDTARNLNSINIMLNDRLNTSNDEKNKFEKMLQTAQNYASELNKTLEFKVKEIDETSSKINQLRNVINDLHSMKLSETNRTQENSIKVIDRLISHMKNTKEVYNENISLKNKELATLTQQNLYKEKSYLEKIFLLETEIKEFTTTIQHLETSIESLEENLKMKRIEIDELQTAKTTTHESFQKVRYDLETKIIVTEDTLKKLEIELGIITKEKRSLEDNMKNLRDDMFKLQSEKANLVELNDQLKIQYSECYINLTKQNKDFEERDNLISDTNKQLFNVKLELEMYKQKHDDLRVEMDNVRHEEGKYKFCISTLEEKNRDFERKIEQLQREKQVLNRTRETMETKIRDLETNLECIIQQLKEKNRDLNSYCEKMEECKRRNELEKELLEKALNDTRSKLEEVFGERDEAVRKYDGLKRDLAKTNDLVYELNSKEISYLQEIQLIKSELDNSFQKYAAIFDSQQELKLEHEAQVNDLTGTIHNLVVDRNRLDQENKELTKRLGQVSKEQETLQEQKIAIEVRLVNLQKAHEQELETAREQFALESDGLKRREKELDQALNKALADLEAGKGVKTRLEMEVTKITEKLEDVAKEKNHLESRIETLELSKKEVDSEYSRLKLTHEKHIIEGEKNIKEREKVLQASIEKLKLENQQSLDDCRKLQETIFDLEKKHQIYVEEHERFVIDSESELKFNIDKIAGLEALNVALSKEQETLLKRTRKLEQNLDEISKLKSAYDILQTGKDRIEIDLKTAKEAINKLEQEKSSKEPIFESELRDYKQKVADLMSELENKNQSIVEKDRTLNNKIRELNELRIVFEAVKSEKETLESRLKESRKLHHFFLTQIEEENLNKIDNMALDFTELKTKYKNIHESLKKLKEEKRHLIKSLETAKSVENELESQIEDKQRLYNQVIKQSLIYEDIISEERSKMNDFIHELSTMIEELESVQTRKIECENNALTLNCELNNAKKAHDEVVKTKIELYETREQEILRNRINFEHLKNELSKCINNVCCDFMTVKSANHQLEEALQQETQVKDLLEVKLLNLMNEKVKYEQVSNVLVININKLSNLLIEKSVLNSSDFTNLTNEEITILTEEIEKNIADVYGKINEINKSIGKLHEEKSLVESKISFLEKEKLDFDSEKSKLLKDYEILHKEKVALKECSEHEKLAFEEEVNNLKSKLENTFKFAKEIESLKTENGVLHQTVQSLKQNNVKAYGDYQKFLEVSKLKKTGIDNLMKDRNLTETVVNELKQNLFNLQMKFVHLPQELLYKQYFEQKESLQIIVEDIQKQFNRYSRMSLNIMSNFAVLSEKVIEAIFSEKSINVDSIFNDLEIEETIFKIDELKDRASDGLEQIVSLGKIVDTLEIKTTKVLLKENLKPNQVGDKNEDDYRKKYISIKQKLTLAENVKNNYEKKLKQLREENKKLVASNKNMGEDLHYKTLIQQHVETKENYEQQIGELKTKQIELENKLAQSQQEIRVEKEVIKSEKVATSDALKEVELLRNAYSNLMGEKAKLDSEHKVLKRTHEEQLHEYSHVKEAYEKLLEENNRMMTENDTLKFKRNREKEEHTRQIEKQRKEFSSRQESMVAKIRAEYDEKLQKMTNKVLEMYKEDIGKQMQRSAAEKADAEAELREARRAIERLRRADSRSATTLREVVDCARSAKRSSVHPARTVAEARKCATLPKSMAAIEEDVVGGRKVGPADIASKLEMEDEGDCFHNKYLADLKGGRCVVSSGRESTSSRISELAQRNSMVPPHLKSSYPAELQMVTPSRFKDEDVKAGTVDLDDSMSAKLLPPDKAARRKEQGTTSYKRPGPPTPSKHGGRASLQGAAAAATAEAKEAPVLRDLNDGKTPKRSTPNKLKAFFLGRTSIGRSSSSNVENQPPSPKPKQAARLFRKGR